MMLLVVLNILWVVLQLSKVLCGINATEVGALGTLGMMSECVVQMDWRTH